MARTCCDNAWTQRCLHTRHRRSCSSFVYAVAPTTKVKPISRELLQNMANTFAEPRPDTNSERPGCTPCGHVPSRACLADYDDKQNLTPKKEAKGHPNPHKMAQRPKCCTEGHRQPEPSRSRASCVPSLNGSNDAPNEACATGVGYHRRRHTHPLCIRHRSLGASSATRDKAMGTHLDIRCMPNGALHNALQYRAYSAVWECNRRPQRLQCLRMRSSGLAVEPRLPQAGRAPRPPLPSPIPQGCLSRRASDSMIGLARLLSGRDNVDTPAAHEARPMHRSRCAARRPRRCPRPGSPRKARHPMLLQVQPPGLSQQRHESRVRPAMPREAPRRRREAFWMSA